MPVGEESRKIDGISYIYGSTLQTMRLLILSLLTFSLLACQQGVDSKSSVVSSLPKTTLSREEVYDKVLGMLLGSAIGDAMGAPTEMWAREAIQLEYGFVNRLDSMVREPSAEGTWLYNLPAGGTTDDTRWKKLAIGFLLTQPSGQLEAGAFATHLVNEYETYLKRLKAIQSFDAAPYEAAMMRVAWLQEWARVAKPYAEKNYPAYSDSLSRFYGGEMVCAGLLYAPAVGAFYPGNPVEAYRQMFKISLFDLGYARDISSLTAAMVAEAMRKNPSKTAIINVAGAIDPHSYFKSRLVGRTAFRILRDARFIVSEANKLQIKNIDLAKLPKRLPADTLYIARMYKAFELLDAKNQDMPFHAGEIDLQILTALLFCDFDFEKTLAFLVNLGRDNDTTSAIAGGLLGAYWGANRLPEKMKKQVLIVNKEKLGTDLELLAKKMTDSIIAR
jgi:ADP-ribosylglycohydrolase